MARGNLYFICWVENFVLISNYTRNAKTIGIQSFIIMFKTDIKKVMTNTFYNTIIQITIDKSSFKWGVIVSGELMFLENYGNCDITNTVALLL